MACGLHPTKRKTQLSVSPGQQQHCMKRVKWG